jgi:hypothetical protein
MGRPRALDWGQTGLVEAVAYPYFCGDQISERETGRAVEPSASSRGGSSLFPSLDGTSSCRTRCPRLYSELNRDRKNVRTTFRSRLRSHASAPYVSLLYRRSSTRCLDMEMLASNTVPVQRGIGAPRSIMIKSAVGRDCRLVL